MRSTATLRNNVAFIQIFIIFLHLEALSCMTTAASPHEKPYVSLLERDPNLPEIEVRPAPAYPALPHDLRPEHRSLMITYEQLGFPPVQNCAWADRACGKVGWLCDGWILVPPRIPRYGADSDEDLPHQVSCTDSDAEINPDGFEQFIRAIIAYQDSVDSDPKHKLSDLYWIAPPRDSRHLTWTTFAHWALERNRRDLFDMATPEAERASTDRCKKGVKKPLASSVAANAAASLAAAAKHHLYVGDWKQAREQATRALHLLSQDSRACNEGPNAYYSGRSALRRADLELSLPELPDPGSDASTEERLDYWLVTIMRNGIHPSDRDDAAIAKIRAQGETIVPLLLPHMSELALYSLSGDGWFQPPTSLGDVVVTIIEDIAGQEFTSPGRRKSTDIGAHLAIYAWWAGRQKALAEEAAAQEPTSLWQRVRKKLGFDR